MMVAIVFVNTALLTGMKSHLVGHKPNETSCWQFLSDSCDHCIRRNFTIKLITMPFRCAKIKIKLKGQYCTHAHKSLHTRVERTTNTHKYPAENARLLLVSYCVILLIIAPNNSFPVQSKTKKNYYGVASTLSMFKSSARRLQCPGSRSATNLVHHRNNIVSFFTLNHTHCHLPAPAQLSNNHVQPPKLLNKANTAPRS